MLNEDVLKIVLNNKTFGRDEAADICRWVVKADKINR